jgi:hypothetical protein
MTRISRFYRDGIPYTCISRRSPNGMEYLHLVFRGHGDARVITDGIATLRQRGGEQVLSSEMGVRGGCAALVRFILTGQD